MALDWDIYVIAAAMICARRILSLRPDMRRLRNRLLMMLRVGQFPAAGRRSGGGGLLFGKNDNAVEGEKGYL